MTTIDLMVDMAPAIRLLRDVLVDRMRSAEQNIDHAHIPGLCAGLAELIVEPRPTELADAALMHGPDVRRALVYLRRAVNQTIASIEDGLLDEYGFTVDEVFYQNLVHDQKPILYPER